MKTHKDLVENGYYWWLPEYLSDNPGNPDNWTIISWHPENNAICKVGFFVGPLSAPIYEKVK